jgi:hypothetical protein
MRATLIRTWGNRLAFSALKGSHKADCWRELSLTIPLLFWRSVKTANGRRPVGELLEREILSQPISLRFRGMLREVSLPQRRRSLPRVEDRRVFGSWARSPFLIFADTNRSC